MINCKKCSDRKYIIRAGKKSSQAFLCPACSAHCSKCNDTEYVIIENQAGEAFAKECDCKVLRDRIKNYNICGIPKIYWEAEWSNFRNLEKLPSLAKALESSRKVLSEIKLEGGKGILYSGNVGAGKTRILCVVLKELIFDRGIRCRFVEFSKLLYSIRQGYDQNLPESEIIDPLAEIDVLAIDELGKGKGSPWEISILDTLITQRYNTEKTTFFTTNYATKSLTSTERSNGFETDIEERVQSRIYSRLREMCHFVEIEAPDFRIQQEILMENRKLPGAFATNSDQLRV